VRSIIAGGGEQPENTESHIEFDAYLVRADGGGACSAVEKLSLHMGGLTNEEREIILSGCLMNYYAARQ